MRVLIFNTEGDIKHELDRVIRHYITPGGDLVCEFHPGESGGMIDFVAARGTWDSAESLLDTPAPPKPAEQTAQLPAPVAPPVVPGPAEPPTASYPALGPREATELTYMPANPRLPDLVVTMAGPKPHSPELAEALTILCTCAQLRCPVLVDLPPQPKVLGLFKGRTEDSGQRQCVGMLGHEPITARHPHIWAEGEWPYGAAYHHPKCPRNPEVYNRPKGEEGQPQHAAGITSADGLAPSAGPVQAPEPGQDRTLIRPYVAGAHRAS